MLQPVKYKTVVDVAIENIGKYIAENMQKGDVLPSERELAERLQISRNITREALQHFRTLGIIESKPKVGAIITRLFPADAYAGYKPLLAIYPHTFDDLAHLRLTLELGCVERAVKNVTDEDIAELKKMCEKISTLGNRKNRRASKTEALLQEADIEFHTRFMKLSGNALINSMIPLVIEFFEKQYLCGKKIMNRRESGYQEHFDMVEALQKGDCETLSTLIRSHLMNYLERQFQKSSKMPENSC